MKRICCSKDIKDEFTNNSTKSGLLTYTVRFENQSEKMFEFVRYLILFSVAAATITQHHFEFENALTDAQNANGDLYRMRSQASNKKTIYYNSPDLVIELKLCIVPVSGESFATLYVNNIRYSNDGKSDKVTVGFPDNVIGSFSSKPHSHFGHFWNVFEDSGPIGGPRIAVLLPKGEYTLRITADIDTYGIELDNIRINVDNLENKDLFCGPNTVSSPGK
jgi:hypothetical protein